MGTAAMVFCLLEMVERDKKARETLITTMTAFSRHNFPLIWQAYADSLNVKPSDLTKEEKQQAFMDHLMRGCQCSGIF